MKKALITGIAGQDGSYLSKFLLEKGYKVFGGRRRSGSGTLWRHEYLGISDQVEIIDFELTEQSNIYRTIEKIQPDEIYNLAAQSFVETSFEQPIYTSLVDGIAVTQMLEAIRNVNPNIKLYQASTSEMYGKVQSIPQTEDTPFYPRSPYGVAKVYAYWICKNYRESYDTFCCNGILFNHESPLRGEEFVTRKITKSLARIKLGKQEFLELGNLDSKRDWGFAGDYVEGMYMMMQNNIPDDFVLATNETNTIRHFIEIAAKELDFDIEWRGSGENEVGIDTRINKTIVRVNPKFYRPAEVDILIGDCSKAKRLLGWKPKTKLNELASMMIKYDFDVESRLSYNI